MARPVVFIPGYPGSDLWQRQPRRRLFLRIPKSFRNREFRERLKGPSDLGSDDGVVAGLPVARFSVRPPLSFLLSLFIDLKRAESLYDLLRPLYPAGRFLHNVTRFGWDWRRPVWDPITQEALRRAILELARRRRRKVVLLVHSTGGLILRYLLEHHLSGRGRADERREVLESIERIIAMGVPWAGTLKTFRVLAGQMGLEGLLSPERAQEVLGHSWSAFDVAPPDPAKAPRGVEYPMLTRNERGATSPLVDLRWLPPDRRGLRRRDMELRAQGADERLGVRTLRPDFGGIPVTNLAGWGFETAVGSVITAARGGATVSFEDRVDLLAFDDGDGTVASRSAGWIEGPEITTFHVPIGVRGAGPIGVQKHITIWGNEGSRNLLEHLVGERPFRPYAYAVADWQEVRDPASEVRIRCAAQLLDGSLPEEAHVRLVRPDRLDTVPFKPELGGRLLVLLKRASIPRAGRFRILELKLGWRQGGRVRETGIFRFLLEP